MIKESGVIDMDENIEREVSEEIEGTEEYTVSEPYTDPIIIYDGDLEKLDEFKKGVFKGAYYAGIFSAMISNGFSYEDGVNFTFAVLNAEMTESVSKNQVVQMERQSV